MEPTSTFATIVGLICNFRQEQASQGSLTADDFFQWLNEHKHQVIRSQIEGNMELQNGIVKLLQANRENLLEHFEKVNLLLAQLLSKVNGFQTIVHSTYPTIEFSEQAVGILKILVESGGQELILLRSFEGTVLEIVGDDGISYGEPRFLEDDLNTLCKHEFLTRRVVNSSEQYFRLTRQGVRYIEYISSPDKAV